MELTDWLSQQRSLLAAATPGPWKVQVGGGHCNNYDSIIAPECQKDKDEEPDSYTCKTIVHSNFIEDEKQCTKEDTADNKYGVKSSWDADFIASVRTEHERALLVIERYREIFEGLSDSRGTAAVIAYEALAYFPEVGEK